ncbi:hypothetical protein PT974_10839 [Cladobotryum mycophilum]|uniref:GST N-terminal domain-containing protein n=1 Tax=Cladobotryum mycophilum TaxID=491253 RepID=A0ABR0SAX9_9HYPO
MRGELHAKIDYDSFGINDSKVAAIMAKFTLYSFVGSQWVGVAHLALAEGGFTKDEYDLVEVDLGIADNFSPEYLAINPNGTVPSLTSPDLEKPLSESTDILRYINGFRGGNLIPKDAAAKAKVQAILDVVHSDEVGTNLILLQFRDAGELEGKKTSPFNDFVSNRQARLVKERAAHPEHPFYGPKSEENGVLHKLYVTDIGDEHHKFFKLTHDMYRDFAQGMEKLDQLLVLPYAAGNNVTEADFHVVPWLSHAMAGAGTDPKDVQNFEVLEKLIQKSVSGFKVGGKTREWWSNISSTKAFKEVFSTLH